MRPTIQSYYLPRTQTKPLPDAALRSAVLGVFGPDSPCANRNSHGDITSYTIPYGSALHLNLIAAFGGEIK